MIDRIILAAICGGLGAIFGLAATLFCLGLPDRLRRRECNQYLAEWRVQQQAEADGETFMTSSETQWDPGDQVP